LETVCLWMASNSARMVEDPTICSVIILRGGMTYNVKQPDSTDEVIVRSRKVLIGNPILTPTLDGTDCMRLFRVVTGCSLDFQFVRTSAAEAS
jgi:hypothetical protein